MTSIQELEARLARVEEVLKDHLEEAIASKSPVPSAPPGEPASPGA